MVLSALNDFIQRVRDYAAQGLLNRGLVYAGIIFLSALLSSVIVSLFGWGLSPATTLPWYIIIAAALFYLLDPDNEYSRDDVLATFIGIAFVMLIYWAAGMAASGTLLKQYAAPLVFMQEAGQAVATMFGVAKTDILGLLVINFALSSGFTFTAEGIKHAITARS